MKNKIKNLALYAVIALIIFLPFSSWIISLTGRQSLSLIRDILSIAIIFFALLNYKEWKNNLKPVAWFVIAFLIWGVLTFLWREASIAQWLKGFRFDFMPVLAFLSILFIDFSAAQKGTVYKTVLWTSVAIIIFAILELFGYKIPLTTSLSGAGALESVHYVGETHIYRLQAFLAGPNALGLYLLAVTCFCIFINNKIIKFLSSLVAIILLVLTFSRSAWIGAAVVIATALFLWLTKNFSKKFAYLSFLIVFALAAVLFTLPVKSAKVSEIITHGSSSSLRFDQYKRIWNQKFEIGLIGRGTGTAGPSSQNRLDGGENHWTENVYLDLFEELGLAGIIIYLGIVVLAIRNAYKNREYLEGKIAFYILLGFAVSGLFINYYTGQVGIFLMWIAAALPYRIDEHDTIKSEIL